MSVKYIRLRYSEEQRESQQEMTLDGVRVRLRMMYNATTQRYHIDLLTPERVEIVSGLALVPGVDLLRPYKHLAVPHGELYLYDAQYDAPADLDTLDVSALLLYREV